MISHPNSFLPENLSDKAPSGDACNESGSDTESETSEDVDNENCTGSKEFCQFSELASMGHFLQLPLHSQFEILSKELQSRAAVWILKSKEGHKLTQKAMDAIIEDVTAFNHAISAVQDWLCCQCYP